jgi:hypothetical protein
MLACVTENLAAFIPWRTEKMRVRNRTPPFVYVGVPPETIADPCEERLPPPPLICRESRCRRAAKRRGGRLRKHVRTGLFMLDGVEGLTLEECETALFGECGW